jgi:HK97 family phage major capsid protein
MKNSKALKEERALKLQEFKGLNEKGEKATPEELTRANALADEIESLNSEILQAEKRDKTAILAAEMGNGNKDFSQKDEKDLSQFRMAKMLRSAMNQTTLDGVEAEVAQMAAQEARENNVSVGGYALPSVLFRVARREEMEKRASDVATAAAAGYLVATDFGGVVPALMPRLQLVAMGAELLTGLVGNLDMVRDTANLSVAWEGEIDETASTDPTLAKYTFSPKRLAAFTTLSKMLMLQSSVDIENMIRRKLSDAISIGVDAAGINGSGSSGQPTGILGYSGVNDVAMGTNGAVPSWAKIVEMETAVANQSADVNSMYYLTTPGVVGKLKTTENSGGTNGVYIIPPMSQEINGYGYRKSTNVPSTLTKGASSGNCHAAIFGDFSKVQIGNWGMVDIVVDQYTAAKTAQVVITVNSFWDVQVAQPKALSRIKDLLLA